MFNSSKVCTVRSAWSSGSPARMPIAYMPQALIPAIPAWASSNPIASSGLIPMLSAAFTKISGSGLPFVKVAGSTIDLKFNEQLKGISRMDSLERILAHGNQQDKYTQEQKEALAAEKNEAYVQLLQNLTPTDLLPGVKAFLLEAKDKNMPCAIASASKNAPFILEKLGVIDLFDAIVDHLLYLFWFTSIRYCNESNDSFNCSVSHL